MSEVKTSKPMGRPWEARGDEALVEIGPLDLVESTPPLRRGQG